MKKVDSTNGKVEFQFGIDVDVYYLLDNSEVEFFRKIAIDRERRKNVIIRFGG